MEWSVLGMTLEPDDDLAQPLAAAVIVKALDAAGQIAYYCVSTEGLSSVEILGMMHWGAAVALDSGDDA